MRLLRNCYRPIKGWFPLVISESSSSTNGSTRTTTGRTGSNSSCSSCHWLVNLQVKLKFQLVAVDVPPAPVVVVAPPPPTSGAGSGRNGTSPAPSNTASAVSDVRHSFSSSSNDATYWRDKAGIAYTYSDTAINTAEDTAMTDKVGAETRGSKLTKNTGSGVEGGDSRGSSAWQGGAVVPTPPSARGSAVINSAKESGTNSISTGSGGRGVDDERSNSSSYNNNSSPRQKSSFLGQLDDFF